MKKKVVIITLHLLVFCLLSPVQAQELQDKNARIHKLFKLMTNPLIPSSLRYTSFAREFLSLPRDRIRKILENFMKKMLVQKKESNLERVAVLSSLAGRYVCSTLEREGVPNAKVQTLVRFFSDMTLGEDLPIGGVYPFWFLALSLGNPYVADSLKDVIARVKQPYRKVLLVSVLVFSPRHRRFGRKLLLKVLETTHDSAPETALAAFVNLTRFTFGAPIPKLVQIAKHSRYAQVYALYLSTIISSCDGDPSEWGLSVPEKGTVLKILAPNKTSVNSAVLYYSPTFTKSSAEKVAKQVVAFWEFLSRTFEIHQSPPIPLVFLLEGGYSVMVLRRAERPEAFGCYFPQTGTVVAAPDRMLYTCPSLTNLVRICLHECAHAFLHKALNIKGELQKDNLIVECAVEALVIAYFQEKRIPHPFMAMVKEAVNLSAFSPTPDILLPITKKPTRVDNIAAKRWGACFMRFVMRDSKLWQQMLKRLREDKPISFDIIQHRWKDFLNWIRAQP